MNQQGVRRFMIIIAPTLFNVKSSTELEKCTTVNIDEDGGASERQCLFSQLKCKCKKYRLDNNRIQILIILTSTVSH